MGIHPSSIISENAKIGANVTIGPFCVVHGNVELGDNCILDSHVVLGSPKGKLKIGKDNHFFSGSVIGGPPQDLKYAGEETSVIIGSNNMIRECATINMGTPTGGGVTTIGDDNLLMAYVHVAHDCIIGNDIVIANSGQLAGHVIVEDHVKIGGVCCISQFARIGTYSYIAGDSTINKDILPYSMAQGKWATAKATNKIGMERAGISKETIQNVHRAIRYIIKGNNTVVEALERVASDCETSKELEHLVAFVKSSERGLAK